MFLNFLSHTPSCIWGKTLYVKTLSEEMKPYRTHTFVYYLIQLLLNSDNMPGTMLALDHRHQATHSLYLYGSHSPV